VSRGTREIGPERQILFAYGAITLSGRPFQNLSAKDLLCNSPSWLRPTPANSHNPGLTTRAGFDIRPV